jgi:hypothetical protein
MKRKILASVLGIAALTAFVALSYGQGQVFFANNSAPSGSPGQPGFDSGVNAPVTFGSTENSGGINAVAGQLVGSEFNADLMYQFGANPMTLLTAENAGATPYPTSFFGTDGDAGNGAGFFQGPVVTIPGYSSGPITFIIQAYNGTNYFSADTTWRGQSAPFTLNSIATGGQPFGDFGSVDGGGSLHSFTVNPAPEPSIFSLAGMGAVALMAFRRKK